MLYSLQSENVWPKSAHLINSYKTLLLDGKNKMLLGIGLMYHRYCLIENVLTFHHEVRQVISSPNSLIAKPVVSQEDSVASL
jgi:hypothetical protein